MTADDFEAYVRQTGHVVARVQGDDGLPYSVIRSVTIPIGALCGRTCDVAIRTDDAVPYLPPTAIHTLPALVPMDSGQPLATQPSPIGPGWQYWSRRYDRPPNPAALWAHILTVLCDDRWPGN
jgi:hypothetical protein